VTAQCTLSLKHKHIYKHEFVPLKCVGFLGVWGCRYTYFQHRYSLQVSGHVPTNAAVTPHKYYMTIIQQNAGWTQSRSGRFTEHTAICLCR